MISDILFRWAPGIVGGFVLAIFVFRINPKFLALCIGYANLASAAATQVTKKL